MAEAILGHVKKGLVGVYDKHKHEPEKTAALALWGAHARDLITPPPA